MTSTFGVRQKHLPSSYTSPKIHLGIVLIHSRAQALESTFGVVSEDMPRVAI
jgi:hypothetical protein